MKDYQKINAYNFDRYDRIQVLVPKGNRKIIKSVAKKLGKTMNNYITTLIENDLKGRNYEKVCSGN